MARLARLVVPGHPHQVTQHGTAIDERLIYTAFNADGTQAGQQQYYHANHQGTIVAMSQASTLERQQRYTYDVYGLPGQAEDGQPFRYTGRRYDAETGLYYYRARYYSPKLGRFLQTDPIGYEDNMNLYGYTQNDPVNNTDPTGLCPFCLAIPLIIPEVIAAAEGAVVLTGAILVAAGISDLIDDGDEAPGEEGEVIPEGDRLPDDATIVREGSTKPFKDGTGVVTEPDGTLTGVSVNGGVGTVEEVAEGIPHNKGRATTAGEIRKAGGEVVRDPSRNNPNHCLVNGCTNEQLDDIFGPPQVLPR